MWQPKIVPFGTLLACAITLRRNQMAPATLDQPIIRHSSKPRMPDSPRSSSNFRRHLCHPSARPQETSTLKQRPRNNNHILQFIPTQAINYNSYFSTPTTRIRYLSSTTHSPSPCTLSALHTSLQHGRTWTTRRERQQLSLCPVQTRSFG